MGLKFSDDEWETLLESVLTVLKKVWAQAQGEPAETKVAVEVKATGSSEEVAKAVAKALTDKLASTQPVAQA